MRVAFTATGTGLDAQIDQRFGRARCVVIVDSESGDVEMMDNEQNLNAAQGAGIQTAQNISSAAVGAVVTGHCGPKAFRTLKAAGIRVYTGVSGTVEQGLAKFRDGELRAADGADVESHW